MSGAAKTLWRSQLRSESIIESFDRHWSLEFLSSRSFSDGFFHNGPLGTSVLRGFMSLRQNIFILFFRRKYKFLSLTFRESCFSIFRLISLCLKIYHEKENNISRTKACGRDAFFFYVLYLEKSIFFLMIFLYSLTD